MNEQQRKVKLILPGIMGTEAAAKGLLGDEVDFTETDIPGFKVMVQPKPPSYIWEGEFGIKQFWDDQGKPFPGGYTLQAEEGATAHVGVVTFPNAEAFKSVVPLLDFWSGHDRSKDPETREHAREWYKYQAINVEDPETDVTYLTEQLTPESIADSPIQEPEGNYSETQLFQDGTKEMAKQAREYRESLVKQDPEGKLTSISAETEA